MERLDDLVLFKHVVEAGGFAAAARNLGMQRSKLSRRIAELEQRMGVRLLQRNTRRMAMTDAGQRVYHHACAVAQEAKAAFDIAAELKGEVRGTLRITCPVSFAGAVLMPVIREFCDVHPHVNVAIDASDRMSDLVGENFEVAFRMSSTPFADSSLVARTIGEVPMCMAAHPALLQGQAAIAHPDDLRRFDLLAHSGHDTARGLAFTHPAEGRRLLQFTARLLSGNMSVLHAAVLNGLGLACLPRYLCAPYLAAGHLVDVFDVQDKTRGGWQPEPVKAYALMPASRGMTLATRSFLDFCIARLAARTHSGAE